MLALWLAPSVFASDWYLETHDRRERSEVTAWQEKLEPTGLEVRVVRRFVDGEGWRFIVRAEGFAGEDEARTAARSMADAIAAPVVVLETDGRTSSRVAEVAPSEGTPVVAENEEAGDASADLQAAVAALGVQPDLRASLEDGPLLLAYRRTLPDGRVADHTWARDASGAVRVEIDPVEGNVVPSRLLVTGDHAWLAVRDGEWTEQNAVKADYLVDSMGPTDVVPLLLQLQDAVATRREFERMQVAGTGSFDGEKTTKLTFGGDSTSDPLVLELDGDHLPVRLQIGEGDAAVIHEFREYRTDDGHRLPSSITTLRGGQRDVVAVEKLDAGASMPSEWFRAPR